MNNTTLLLRYWVAEGWDADFVRSVCPYYHEALMFFSSKYKNQRVAWAPHQQFVEILLKRATFISRSFQTFLSFVIFRFKQNFFSLAILVSIRQWTLILLGGSLKTAIGLRRIEHHEWGWKIFAVPGREIWVCEKEFSTTALLLGTN